MPLDYEFTLEEETMHVRSNKVKTFDFGSDEAYGIHRSDIFGKTPFRDGYLLCKVSLMPLSGIQAFLGCGVLIRENRFGLSKSIMGLLF